MLIFGVVIILNDLGMCCFVTMNFINVGREQSIIVRGRFEILEHWLQDRGVSYDPRNTDGFQRLLEASK